MLNCCPACGGYTLGGVSMHVRAISLDRRETACGVCTCRPRGSTSLGSLRYPEGMLHAQCVGSVHCMSRAHHLRNHSLGQIAMYSPAWVAVAALKTFQTGTSESYYKPGTVIYWTVGFTEHMTGLPAKCAGKPLVEGGTITWLWCVGVVVVAHISHEVTPPPLPWR